MWELKNDVWGKIGHPIWGNIGHNHKVNKFMSTGFFLADWSRKCNLGSPSLKIMDPLGKQCQQT
jgi:hypothetical protein